MKKKLFCLYIYELNKRNKTHLRWLECLQATDSIDITHEIDYDCLVEKYTKMYNISEELDLFERDEEEIIERKK